MTIFTRAYAGVLVSTLALSLSTAASANFMRDHLDAITPPPTDDSFGKIIRGVPATEDYGFPVALMTPDGFQFCGGSLVDATTVITAAHCVAFEDTNQIRVLHGTQTLGSGGTLVELAREPLMHPQYSINSLDYDVAVLHLAAELPGPYIEVGTYETAGELIAAGAGARVVGWGINDADTGTAPEILLEGPQEMESLASCREKVAQWSPYFAMKERMMCASHLEVTGGPCNGDSGGPLFGRAASSDPWVLLGTVSWGWAGCVSPQKIAIYGNLLEVEDWLAEARDPDVDAVALAQKYRALDLDGIAFRRKASEGRPFEKRAFEAIAPAFADYLGAAPPADEVEISAQYLLANATGGLPKLAIFFRHEIDPNFALVMTAMTEDTQYYHFGGLMPFADKLYIDRKQKLHDWHPLVVVKNGSPLVFAYDNEDFYFQPFMKDAQDKLFKKMKLGRRLGSAD